MVQSNLDRYLGPREQITSNVLKEVLRYPEYGVRDLEERCAPVLRWLVRRAVQSVVNISDRFQYDVMKMFMDRLIMHRRVYRATLLMVLQEFAAVMLTQKKPLPERVVHALKGAFLWGTRRTADDAPLGEEIIELLASITGETVATAKRWVEDVERHHRR